jgi:hydrogenase maturation protease
MKTLVIGLGNPILTDDGVGIYASRLVKYALPDDTDIDVIECSIGGLSLMENMIGYERVILIDAIWQPNTPIGQMFQFDAGNLPETLNTASAHDADLPTAVNVGRELGAILPELEDIHIVAIQIDDTLTFGEDPTPPVAAAIPLAATSALKLLGIEEEKPFPPYRQLVSNFA